MRSNFWIVYYMHTHNVCTHVHITYTTLHTTTHMTVPVLDNNHYAHKSHAPELLSDNYFVGS